MIFKKERIQADQIRAKAGSLSRILGIPEETPLAQVPGGYRVCEPVRASNLWGDKSPLTPSDLIRIEDGRVRVSTAPRRLI